MIRKAAGGNLLALQTLAVITGPKKKKKRNSIPRYWQIRPSTRPSKSQCFMAILMSLIDGLTWTGGGSVM